MPVSRAICWVLVIWVAWWVLGSGMGREFEVGLWSGKCEQDSKGRRAPPSRERET